MERRRILLTEQRDREIDIPTLENTWLESDIIKGAPVPVIISVYNDRSFTFDMKTPPASYLLKKAAGIKSGSGRPNTEKVGTVTRAQLEEIVETKRPDLTAADMDAAVRTIAGSARAMGLNVEG